MLGIKTAVGHDGASGGGDDVGIAAGVEIRQLRSPENLLRTLSKAGVAADGA
jgi:hypothetical protein